MSAQSGKTAARSVEHFARHSTPNWEMVAPTYSQTRADSCFLDGPAVGLAQPESAQGRTSEEPPHFFLDPSRLEVDENCNLGAAESRLGRTRICLFGYCIVGPDRYLMLAAFAFILIPCIIFDVFTLPWTFQYFAKGLGIGLCLLATVLQLLVLGFFWGTACSDPGIVPRVPRPCHIYDGQTDKFQSCTPPKRQDIVIYGQVFKLKYCSTCHIYRTPRTVHCSICDNCVERFDHHCPWVGNCVGRRNYRRFYAFIISTSFLVLFTLAVAAVKLFSVISARMSEGETIGNIFAWRWGEFWDAGALATITLVIVWFIIGLCIYHSYLILTNQTTYEQIKNSCDGEFNPWDRGSVNNVRELLCTRPRPRLFNARRLYKQNQVPHKSLSRQDEEVCKNVASFSVKIADTSDPSKDRVTESLTEEPPETVDIDMGTVGNHHTSAKGSQDHVKPDPKTLQATVCGIEMCAIPAATWSPPSSDHCSDERKASLPGPPALKGPGSFVELPYFGGYETTTAHLNE